MSPISRRGFTQPKIHLCRFQIESFIPFVGSSGSGGYGATSGDADSDAGGSGYFPGADDEGNGAAQIQHTGTAIVAAVVAAKLIM